MNDTFAKTTNAANEAQNPTDKQKEAGNYKHGKIKLNGLLIMIENPFGGYRSGTDSNGTKWSCRLSAHYGYFKGTLGDAVDVFVGNFPELETVWIVNQFVNGVFDEHKVMFGFNWVFIHCSSVWFVLFKWFGFLKASYNDICI